MSTGENIKRIRNIRGITQKELGIAVGIGEESAGPRMAQYETGKRTPKEKMLNKVAGANKHLSLFVLTFIYLNDVNSSL